MKNNVRDIREDFFVVVIFIFFCDLPKYCQRHAHGRVLKTDVYVNIP